MDRVALDTYELIPHDMRAYLRNWGYHFNKKAVELAIRGMKRINHTTGKAERLEPVSKEQIEELMQKYGLKIDDNNGYDFVYYFHQGKADLYKSSIADEQRLCMYVSDMINDADMKGGNAFRHWLVDMDAKGIGIEWSELI